MDVEDKPHSNNFQFDSEKVKSGDYILVELKSKKGNSVHCILIIKKLATEELKVHFLEETGAREFVLISETDSALKSEIDMKM